MPNHKHAISNCAHGIPSTSEPQVLPLRDASHATSPVIWNVDDSRGWEFFQHAHLTLLASMPRPPYGKEHSFILASSPCQKPQGNTPWTARILGVKLSHVFSVTSLFNIVPSISCQPRPSQLKGKCSAQPPLVDWYMHRNRGALAAF